MSKEKINNWILGKQVFGLSISLANEKWEVDYVEVGKKSGSIIVKDKKERLEFEELKDDLPKNARVCLQLNGNGILYKTITQEQKEYGIQGILPNVKADDFILQYYPMKEEKILVAILRRDVLKKVLNELKQLNFWVVDLYLGPISLQWTAHLLEDKNQTVKVNEFCLQLDEAELLSFDNVEQEKLEYTSMGGESLWGNQILSFSSALTCLVKGKSEHAVEEINEIGKEFFAYQSLKKGIAFALGFIFLIVLLNFFLFDSMRNQKLHLNAQLQTGQSLLLNLEDVQKNVNQKEDFLRQSGLNHQSMLSYYSDRIVVDLPENVSLVSMELNPLKSKIKKGKEINYRVNRIVVEGKTSEPDELNNWIRQLKKQEWVSKVEKQEYFLRNKKQAAEFILEVSIH